MDKNRMSSSCTDNKLLQKPLVKLDRLSTQQHCYTMNKVRNFSGVTKNLLLQKPVVVLDRLSLEEVERFAGKSPSLASQLGVAVNNLATMSESDGKNRGPSEPRYPRRQRKKVIREIVEGPDQDEFLFCDSCQRKSDSQKAPARGGPSAGYKEPDRAIRTLPHVLAIGDSSKKEAGRGIWARVKLPKGLVFSPFEGQVRRVEDFGIASDYTWAIERRGKVVAEVDAVDPSKSNWMRFVNCAASKKEENLVGFQFQGKIYYATLCEVPAHSELLIYYGDKFALILGINSQAFDRGAASKDPRVVHSCKLCNKGFTSPIYRDRHQSLTCRHRKYDEPLKAALVYGEPLPLKIPDAFELSAQFKVPGAEERKRFKCGECSYSTNFNNRLKVHVATHTGERRFACAQCDYKAALKRSLAFHLLTHDGVKPFACKVCHFRAVQQSHLRKHMCTHTGDKPYKCTECEFSSKSSSELISHVRYKHTKERPYACTECESTFVTSGALSSHSWTHKRGKRHVCSQCPYKCNDPVSLKRHMCSKHEAAKECGCSLCDYKGVSIRDLRTHMATKHGAERAVACSHCSFKCNQHYALTKHMAAKHGGVKKYACSLCSYRSYDGDSLKDHMSNKHGVEKRVACTHCEFRCNRNFQLSAHMSAKHGAEKKFSCSLCEYKGNQGSNLRRHMAYKHGGETKHSCPYCEYKSIEASAMKRHVKSRKHKD